MTANSKAAIAELLSEARERTLELIEPLDDAQLNRVYSPILSPLAWDLGHIANFEELWLVQTIGEREPLHGELGRFYDAIENPRRTRGELPILRDDELRSYMADVRSRALDVLEGMSIDAGAEDVTSSEGGHEIYTTADSLGTVAKALEAKFGEPRKAALVWKPQNTVAINDEHGEKLLRLIESLNEHDDVQNVYANFEVSDALVAKMGG